MSSEFDSFWNFDSFPSPQAKRNVVFTDRSLVRRWMLNFHQVVKIFEKYLQNCSSIETLS